MAQFSRYLPRGAVIVDVSNETAAGTGPPLLITAAVVAGADDLELEVVAIVQNTADVAVKYQLQIGESWFIPIDSMTGRGVQTIRAKLPKGVGVF